MTSHDYDNEYWAQIQREDEEQRLEEFCNTVLCEDCLYHASGVNGSGNDTNVCLYDEPFICEYDDCYHNMFNEFVVNAFDYDELCFKADTRTSSGAFDTMMNKPVDVFDELIKNVRGR